MNFGSSIIQSPPRTRSICCNRKLPTDPSQHGCSPDLPSHYISKREKYIRVVSSLYDHTGYTLYFHTICKAHLCICYIRDKASIPCREIHLEYISVLPSSYRLLGLGGWRLIRPTNLEFRFFVHSQLLSNESLSIVRIPE
jgi:hypothetical protein